MSTCVVKSWKLAERGCHVGTWLAEAQATVSKLQVHHSSAVTAVTAVYDAPQLHWSLFQPLKQLSARGMDMLNCAALCCAALCCSSLRCSSLRCSALCCSVLCRRWEDNCQPAGSCKDSSNAMFPNGASIDCKAPARGKRTCRNGNWDESSCECKDELGGGWITNDGYFDCPNGLSGRRHCINGVVQGTCSHAGSCKTEDGTWVSSGWGTADCPSGPGKRRCNNGIWDMSACTPDTKSGGCWDGGQGKMVGDGDTFSCTKGGTRMCSKGKWRVLNGDCTSQEIIDEQGKKQIITTMGAPKGL